MAAVEKDSTSLPGELRHKERNGSEWCEDEATSHSSDDQQKDEQNALDGRGHFVVLLNEKIEILHCTRCKRSLIPPRTGDLGVMKQILHNAYNFNTLQNGWEKKRMRKEKVTPLATPLLAHTESAAVASQQVRSF